MRSRKIKVRRKFEVRSRKSLSGGTTNKGGKGSRDSDQKKKIPLPRRGTEVRGGKY